MQPTSKFFLKSLTVWGVIVAAVCSYIQQYTGVNVADQVKPAQLDITQIVVGIIHLIGVIAVIVGRFRAVQPLHITAPNAIPAATTSKLAFICAFAIALAFTLTACGTYTAKLYTTAGSENAAVDNAGPIAPGAGVTSANTASNATVLAVTGTNLVLNPAAVTTGTATAVFKNTVAVQFKDDVNGYTQTVVNAIYTDYPVILADIGNAAKLTVDVGELLQAWGLTPVNPSQRTTVGNIIDIASKVGGDASSLTSVLSGIQTTGTVPTVSAATTSL